MIVRKGDPLTDTGEEWRAAEYGPFESLRYSDAGGRAYLETL